MNSFGHPSSIDRNSMHLKQSINHFLLCRNAKKENAKKNEVPYHAVHRREFPLK